MSIDNIIGEAYDELMQYPNKIYEIFCDYYGEERVDLQGFESKESFVERIKNTRANDLNLRTVENDLVSELEEFEVPLKERIVEYYHSITSPLFILVHFPEVRITNEKDQYTDVKHLWAKIRIKFNGTMVSTFTMNRSEYTETHLMNDYKHSHTSSGFSTEFTYCCLGNGPIRNTCSSLNLKYTEYLWELFCLELDKYMATESLNGGPYIKLSSISKKQKNVIPQYYKFPKPIHSDFKDTTESFIKYLIDNVEIPVNFNEYYGIAISWLEWNVLLSNVFIEWYNRGLKDGKIYVNNLSQFLFKGTIEDSKIMSYDITNNTTYNKIGQKLFTFKGKDIILTMSTDNEEDVYQYFLHSNIVNNITYSLLKIFNYIHGN